MTFIDKSCTACNNTKPHRKSQYKSGTEYIYKVCYDCEKKQAQPGTVKYRKKKSDRVLEHKCTGSLSCVNPILEQLPYCFEHWIKSLYGYKCRNLYDVTYQQMIDLWNRQGGKCAITGEVLIPGKNVTCDHIVPRVLGGTKTIENLRFVSKEINWMKQGKAEPEFKEYLRSLYQNEQFRAYLNS